MCTADVIDVLLLDTESHGDHRAASTLLGQEVDVMQASLQENVTKNGEYEALSDGNNIAYEGAKESHRHPSTSGKSHQRQIRMSLLFVACSVAGVASYSFLSQPDMQNMLPKVPAWLGSNILLTTAGLLLVTGAAKATYMRYTLHVELHRGRLYIQVGVPNCGPPRPEGSIQVLPTKDGRGNGAFATIAIAKGSYLCDYEGDLLSRQEFDSRYPDGVGDFATGIDDEWTIDAASLVKDTGSFQAVHMNHSRNRGNVLRYFNRKMKRVSFFADRDIAAGEELLYDYGRGYWQGREGLEMP
ncbi:hypothetical protein CEUSTIGMA_g4009.t1 [Chlamydomonas eustigma]|uniref:SET domain-containing protein n=1 Tax=Chlamydomonas eustigma TaxID=1157962 RepID=A0A250X0F9_9CHLO|nr:hypothetical protein CEUSTIGMA_g4009.t1 [Chlamydomonas eustigma]|eukprot:GAX76563.1 hypothetical protein CEUSTIGMA_g4009.t1 [Chlamydomonas eustigma]